MMYPVHVSPLITAASIPMLSHPIARLLNKPSTSLPLKIPPFWLANPYLVSPRVISALSCKHEERVFYHLSQN